MKKTFRGLLAVCLAVLIVATSLPLTVFAQGTGTLYGYFLDEETKAPVSGLEVNLENLEHKHLATAKTNADGRFEFTGLEIGEYLVVPGKGSHYADDSEYNDGGDYGYYAPVVSSGENTFFKGGPNRNLKKVTGSVELTKFAKDTEKTLANAVYELYTSNDELLGEYTTDSTGIAFISNLAYGSYYFVEKTAPAGFFLNTEKVAFTVEENDKTVRVVAEDVAKCSVKLVKVDDKTGALLPNVTYELHKNDGTLVGEYVTNASGEVLVSDLHPDSYYFVETKAADDYLVDPTEHHFTLTNDAPDYQLTLENTHYPEVTISKVSAKTGNFVAGAYFHIMQDGKIIKTFGTLDRVEKFFLAPGDYTLVEIAPPTGFLVTEDVPFTVTAQGPNEVVVEDEEIEIEFKKLGQVKEGSFTHNDRQYEYLPDCKFILRDAENPADFTTFTTTNGSTILHGIPAGRYTLSEYMTPDGYTPAEDMEIEIRETSEKQTFVIYNDYSYQDITFRKVDENDLLIYAKFRLTGCGIDEEFVAGRTTLSLEPGEYTLTEIETPAGYVPVQPYALEVLPTGVLVVNGKHTSSNILTITNRKINVAIYKVDAQSKKLIPGVTLNLKSDDGEFDETFETTDKPIIFSGTLKAGDYTLTEVYALNGYKKADPIKFTVAETSTQQVITMENQRLYGSVTITKTGPKFGPVSVKTNADGFKQTVIDFVNGKLADVEYTLYANADIIHPDGVTGVLYKKGDVVKVAKTDLAGEAHFFRLPYGDYLLQETKTIDGYVLDTEKYTFTVDDTNAVEEPANYSFTNELQSLGINFTKVDENDKPLKNAIYGVYTTEDIHFGEGLNASTVKKGSLMATLRTDESGYASTILRVPHSVYQLKELQAPSGYGISPETFDIDFSNSNPDVAANKPFIEYSFKAVDTTTTFEISKVDATSGEYVPGAKLQIVDADGKVYHTWTSSNRPEVFKAMPAGTYTLKELEAPVGYEKAKDKRFIIYPGFPISPIQLKDERTTADLVINKVIKGTETPLAGVKFKVYDDATNEVVAEVTTNNEGVAIVEKLPVAIYKDGKAIAEAVYSIEECSAPDGYVVDKEVRKVTLKDLGLGAVTDDAAVSTNIIVENDFTKLQIDKVDLVSGKELPGAKLAIYAVLENGKLAETPIEQWTSDIEPHKIDKLAPGKYALVEESAPTGYVKAETQFFEVLSSGEVQSVTMKNDYTKVEFLKVDADTLEPLAGAELALYRSEDIADGKVVDGAKPVAKWMSTTEAYALKKVIPGDYVIVETQAPLGYDIAPNIEITIEEKTEVQSFMIANTAHAIPDTGDTAFPTVVAAFAGFSLLGIFMITRKKKREICE